MDQEALLSFLAMGGINVTTSSICILVTSLRTNKLNLGDAYNKGGTVNFKITYFYNYKTDQIKIESLITSAFELWNRPTKFHLANQCPLTAYLYSLCVVKPKCITLLQHNLRIQARVPSQRPLSLLRTELFLCQCVFICSALCC